MNVHIKPVPGSVKLPQITQQHIMEMMRTRHAEGSSERTIGYIRVELRMAFGVAMRLDLVHRNVAAHVEGPNLHAIRFHDLGHSAASLLAARGVDQRTVREILGHSQTSTTLKTYTHIATPKLRNATDRMAELFEAKKHQSRDFGYTFGRIEGVSRND